MSTASCQKVARPLTRCIRKHQSIGSRYITTTAPKHQELISVPAEKASSRPLNPLTTSSRKGERALVKSGINPVGSRRRRAALRTSDNLPFEQLPYQCFQEARKILRADRDEKLKAIATERARIARLAELDAAQLPGGEARKQTRLDSMRRHLERLKILADINDPLIKKRFEDNEGDMNKPIYRHLAEKKWRAYRRPIITQRIAQLALVPDLLPALSPSADVRLSFRTRPIQPGAFVASLLSEAPGTLRVQVFDRGPRLVTIVAIDADVPDAGADAFAPRCHYLAANIALGPAAPAIPLARVSAAAQLVLPWLPPHAQKGAPPHRLVLVVLEQANAALDVAALRASVPPAARLGFSLRDFVRAWRLRPVGVHVFRCRWDEGTRDVMARAGLAGADVEWKRKKVVAVKAKEKPRGWEARHAGPKYRWVRGR